MLSASRNVLFLLLVSTVAALGCTAEMPPDDGEDFGQEDIGEEDGASAESDAEEVSESQQAALGGQTLIQSTHEKCWNAYSTTVINMVTCNDKSPRQSWIFDSATWQIRSAYYWGRCAELPTTLTGKVTLKACNQWQSYQWFPFVPATDGQGRICGFVQDGNGNQICASHTGTSYVYVTPDPSAPDWYRSDY